MPPKKKPSLLIVDPDTHLADILSKRFSAEGWTVRSAKTVDQAEKLLGRKPSDVVLVDPSKELSPEEVLVKLVDSTASGARALILHSADFTRKTIALWKKIEGSTMVRKGERSLSEFVKHIRKVASNK
jgi:DNA-binding NtrC family response regulator